MFLYIFITREIYTNKYIYICYKNGKADKSGKSDNNLCKKHVKHICITKLIYNITATDTLFEIYIDIGNKKKPLNNFIQNLHLI